MCLNILLKHEVVIFLKHKQNKENVVQGRAMSFLHELKDSDVSQSELRVLG